VAWKSGAAKGATGRPVPLLTQVRVDRATRS
jgi:leucyl aminopeptidase